MSIILSTGLLIFSGYVLGEIVERVGLPKISGYILAGILLNPDLLGIINKQFVDETNPLLTISLSLITFSIGGALSFQEVKKTGKSMVVLMLFESLSAFFFVLFSTFLMLYYFLPIFNSTYVILVVSLVLASLAAPTDPSATIAVIHEYKAKGVVSSSMLEIAAFDDVAGIVIYTLVIAISTILIGQSSVEFSQIFLELSRNIGGGIMVGIVLGFLFKFIAELFKKQSEGSLIVITFGLVLLSYGISDFFGFEALLSAMTLGVMVVNVNPFSDKIFNLVERYTDELIFVVFFSLSGLHLQLSSIGHSLLIIVVYILARMAGKFLGIYTGAKLLHTDPKIKKYAAGGLIPQGGIVIGLALLLTEEPAFKDISSTIVGIVIGATLIHELFGPVLSKLSLKKAHEIKQ